MVHINELYAMGLDHARTSRLGLGHCSYTATLRPGDSKNTHHYRDFTLPCEP